MNFFTRDILPGVLSDLADPSDPRHLGLARISDLLLASLREEDINLVIIAYGAVDALLQQHRAHEVCLCTQIHMSKHKPNNSQEKVSLETEDGAL